MSIYTITLKRELLDDAQAATVAAGSNSSAASNRLSERRSDNDFQRKTTATEEGRPADDSRPAAVGESGQGVANEFNLNEANWLDCSCDLREGGRSLQRNRRTDDIESGNNNRAAENKENLVSGSLEGPKQHSSECLEARRRQLSELQQRAKQVVRSVNVTLEVSADLSQPNRIVWYKNQRELTNSERPVFYVSSSKATVGANQEQSLSSAQSQRSIKRTRSKKIKSLRSTGSGVSIEEETTTEIEEEIKLVEEDENDDENDDDVCGGKRRRRRGNQVENEQQLVAKCKQESNEEGSKLTIYNLQDEDYGQYTCRLIDLLHGTDSIVEANLKQQKQLRSSGNEKTEQTLTSGQQRQLQLTKLVAMDEVIEVREGDLNIELGIQILPETNEDEELMSEEEKREFIEATTINWFKDDEKLDQNSAEVLKLFHFTYDQVEGFHRLIVKRATKETEGVYTCVVENESGTSTCSTQLVVGPGNKPKLTSQLQDVTVYVGQSLEFRIKSTGLPPIDSCQWFKDDELIIELATSAASDQTIKSSRNERISMSRSEEWTSTDEKDKVLIFRLCIDALKLDDTGRYRCRINNEFGYDESDCFVKVLQEIIEEHEEIEETIEETLRLGVGAKRSTRDEADEEEESREETTVEERQEVKRQRQERDEDMAALGGDAAKPRFRRKLDKCRLIKVEETTRTTTRTTTTEELIVSTIKDEWSDSRSKLMIRWLVDGREISTTSATDQEDESIRYKVENFYEETSDEILHKLVINYANSCPKRTTRSVECCASNEAGETSTSGRLKWSRAPRFLRKLEDTEANVGEKVAMKVTVEVVVEEEEEEEEEEETLHDDVRFSKDGKLIYSSKSDGLGERDIKTGSKSRVRVRSYEETVEVVEEQETVSRYTARRYSRPITVKKRGRSYELIIEDVQVDQQGTWECCAENALGQTTSCQADLEVFAEPRIVTDLPESVRVQPGKEIRLTVEASGSPRPVFSWFKDGLGIAEEEDRVYTETTTSSSSKSKASTTTSTTTTSTTRRRSSVTLMREEEGVAISGETLIIRDVRPEDAGLYQCKVENRLGQVESRASKMTVLGHGDDRRGAPKIIKDLSETVYELDEGDTVLLRVLAEGQPKPSQHWQKDSEEIVTEVQETRRVEVEQVGQEYKMTIRRTRMEDSGKYKVVLRNELGQTESRTVEVRVNKLTDDRESQRRPSAPSIKMDGEDKTVGVGSNVAFNVQVAGHPKPLITWFKNGRRVTESGDGRVSFIEEETTTTTITEIDEQTGRETGKLVERKETSTIHRLVIKDVRESDEAIYSLKAENDLGTSKSSLFSLTVDKRKEAVDEIEKLSKQKSSQREQIVEEQEEEEEETTTTTTTTVTKTTEERDEEELERRKASSKTRRLEEVDNELDEVDELDEDGKKTGRKTTRTTRTTTTTTKTTTTTTDEQDEEEERRRRQQQEAEDRAEEGERASSKKSKRRVVEEVEDEVEEEEEEEERTKRKVRKDDEKRTREDEDTSRKVVEMEVDEEVVQVDEEKVEKRRGKSRHSRDESIDHSRATRRGSQAEDKKRDSIEEEEQEVVEETIDETIEESRRRRKGPRIVSAPKEVVAGLGSTPELEVEVEEIIEETTETTTTTEETTTKVVWLKNDQPIGDRLVRDRHIELIERVGDSPNTKKRVLRINSLRSSDEGEYVLKVENADGKTQTAPIKVAIDRTMRPGQRPSITPADIVPESQFRAPEVIGVPEEVVAGIGSSPQIEAQIEALPKPELTWFKDGQPITPEELQGGHLEVVDLPTDKPNVVRQALKINNFKPDDVAAYHVKAENPRGETESEPTNVRIDRSMGPRDEPLVTGLPAASSAQPDSAPKIVSVPDEVVAGPGGKPQIEAEVAGSPAPELTWLKDGQPITDRDIRSGHVEVVDLPSDKPDTVKQALKINDLRPTDVADYQVRAENPLGTAESEPIHVKLDRSMGPRDEPAVKGLDSDESPRGPKPTTGGPASGAPNVVRMPEQVVAGPGSSPQIVAEVEGRPEPELVWLKDGRPITDRDLKLGHVEIVNLPSDKPDTVKQALKINDLRPTDVADYQVKAKNPLGEVESQPPTQLKLDRSMSSRDKPAVTPVEGADEAPLVGGQRAPEIVSAPTEVAAGRGGSPVIEAEVAGVPKPELTWLKDGQPISERDLRTGHVEIVDVPTDQADTVKQALKINDLRPTDVASYQVKATNPLGEAESQPTSVKIDRSLSSTDEPIVKTLDTPIGQKPASGDELPHDAFAPSIVSVPEEIVAGRGGAPVIEAEVSGKPLPEVTWYKDGQPIGEDELASGHMKVVDLPTDKPDTRKQALHIDKIQPDDVAAYHVKAENPLGETESEPTNVRIDRSMGPRDEPVVSRLEQVGAQQDTTKPSGAEPASRPPDQFAPKILSVPDEVVAGPGGKPQIETEVAGSPAPNLTWLKDGQPIADRDLRSGKVELIDSPTDKPDTVKQALKINDLRPTDVADYQVRAENPLGTAESEPIHVKLDRSMGPRDEPVVRGLDSDTPRAPKVVSMPKEVVAGAGSSPRLVAVVEGEPEPQLTWLKDGRRISQPDRLGHYEVEELPADKPGQVKQALKINELKPSDAAAYSVRAENPLGSIESEPARVKLDRSMAPQDGPLVDGEPASDADGTGDSAPARPVGRDDEEDRVAPTVVSMPDEVVAGPGSSPLIVAEVTGRPLPGLTWFKDGRPISGPELSLGHVEVVDLPTSKPDTVRQALKINNLKPSDAAAYHVRAENALGETESNPTNLRLDRSMAPDDQPQVAGIQDEEVPMELDEQPGQADQRRRSSGAAKCAPEIVSAPKEVVAAPGSSPELVVEVKAAPEARIEWLKDGQPIPARLLRDNHLELTSSLSPVGANVQRFALKVNDLRPSDVASYALKAENPLGSVESAPIALKLDRSMSRDDEPVVVVAVDEARPVPGAEETEAPRIVNAPSDQPQVSSAEPQMAPKILKVPREIAAGPGSSPVIEAEVSGSPKPEVTWFKDGHPISERDLEDGRLELVERPAGDKPGVVRQALKVADMKPSDVAAYHVKAANPLGEAESRPCRLKLDRGMSSFEEPVVRDLAGPDSAQVDAGPAAGRKKSSAAGDSLPGAADDSSRFAPEIVGTPEEVVAGRGGAPMIEAVVRGKPEPELTWFKDGQPIAPEELKSGHLELVDLPAGRPDTKRQALKINDLKPDDVAAYHVRAENPLGETESEPTNVRIDRSMDAQDEPRVTGFVPEEEEEEEAFAAPSQEKPQLTQAARNIKCPLGASPVLDVEVTGGQPDKVEWLKDGQVVVEKPDMHVELESLPDGTHKLHINNFQPTDEGLYTLRATNAAGAAESGPIKVTTAEAPGPSSSRRASRAVPQSDLPADEMAPEIINATEEVVAGPGSHPALEVHVRANPEAQVSWFKNGQPLTDKQMGVGHLTLAKEKSEFAPDAIKYVLKIDRMRPSDAATYSLHAKNPLGTADSKQLQLRLDRDLEADETPVVKRTIDELPDRPASGDAAGQPGDFAPQFLETPDEVVAGAGSSPTLEVAIKARPAPETQWFKDGQPLDKAELDSGHLVVTREQSPDDADLVRETLQVKNLKPADVAAYHVLAENPLGAVESAPTNVRIDRTMNARDEPQVSKVESPFVPDGGDSSAVRAPQAPSIKRVPRKIVAPLGSSPCIEVEIAGSPKPEVVWLKDGRQVGDQRGHLAITELPNGVYRLTISNLKAVDQGDFVVKATNEAGEVQSAPIALVVDNKMSPSDEPQVIDSTAPPTGESPGDSAQQQAPLRGFAPKVLRVSDEVVGQVGGVARVQVEVSASPEANVNWLLDGQQIPSRHFDEGHVRVSAEKVSPSNNDATAAATTTIYTIEVDGLKPTDAGTYQLEAENPFGTARSPSVRVKFPAEDVEEAIEPSARRKLRAPVIKRVPKQVVAAEGSSPVLEVEVRGEPVPEIVWFRNGKRIERTDAHYTFEDVPDEGVYRLTVNDCSKAQDEGDFTVVATNEAGSDQSSPIKLLITPKVSGFAPQLVSMTQEVVSGAGSSPTMEVTIRASPEAEVVWHLDGQPIDMTSKQSKAKYRVRREVTQQEKDVVKYVLEIKDLRPTDVGAYHVRAENALGCLETEPINVRIDRDMAADEAPVASVVAEPPVDAEEEPDKAAPTTSTGKRPIRAPVIKRMPRRVVAGVGSNPVIELEISGEPKPQVVWFKNGKRVTEIKNRVEFVELPNGVFQLCFTDVKLTDQAEYSVVATNEAGTIDSGPIELIVDRSLSKSLEPLVLAADELPAPIVVANADGPIEAPTILGLDDAVQARPGQTVRLEAEVKGNPKPDIKWLKDGDEVELNIVSEVPDSNRHSLTLRNVNDLYDGVYSLVAGNVAGVARKEARVSIVDQLVDEARPSGAAFEPAAPAVAATKRKSVEEPHEKPFIKRGLKFAQVNQGRSIKFEVQIDGKYDELIWMKDGEQINLSHGMEIDGAPVGRSDATRAGLEDDDDDDDDDDTSTLKASDDERDATEVAGGLGAGAKPKRRFPPRILMRPRNVLAGPGSRVAFEVRFEGEPRPEVVWLKDGVKVLSTQDGKISIEEVGDDLVRLVIEDVQRDDVASYQVVLENNYGLERSIPVRLELDEDMPASDDLANSTTVESSPPDDSASTAGKPLKRGRAPRILSRPRPVHAGRGSSVAFEVQVAGEPEPVVNWYRDGRVIKQTSDGHVRIEEYSNGCVRLVLSDITDQDVGQYHVVAENKLGSDRTIPVSLTIDETTTTATTTTSEFTQISEVPDALTRAKRGGRPPRILMRPRQLMGPIGGEVSLEVLVVGHTKPTITWYKDGHRLEVDGKRVRVEESSTERGYQRLVISELKPGDAGAYQVSAENDFGVSMSQPSSVLTVSESVAGETTTTATTTTTTETVETFYEHYVDNNSMQLHDKASPSSRRAPRFTVKPRNRKAPVGSKVEFEVKVSGEPKPDVVWYKNGRRVHTTPSGRVRVEEFSDGGSRLVIEDLEETDHGVYAAEAQNEWGKARTDDVQLRVTQRTEVSERLERTQRGSATVTTRTKKTRSHYTFSEERHGYVTLTINDAQLDHDGDYKLVVRNKWGEASTQAPLVVIPKVEPRASVGPDRSTSGYDEQSSSADGRESRNRRTPFDELEDYGHELDKSVGIFGSESRYQSGEDTYLLQLRDTEFPLRLRKYLRFGARQSPSLRSNLMDAHWGAGARVTIRERRKFREVMDEEIDDEKMGRDPRPTPMRLQKEVGTCGYAAAQLESLRVEAADRVLRRSAEGGPGSTTPVAEGADMMPPFFRVKLKDAVIEESAAGARQEAVFVCLAAGEPKPDYSWFRNDVIITPDVNRMQIVALPGGGGGSELRIREPRLHDAGCFKCVAFNVHGNVTTRARLRIASRPSRPEPPEVSSATAREVFLQWRPPRDNIYDANAADVLGYKLEMSQSSVGQDDNWSTLAADIGHEFYVVDDLSPSTSYTFRVSARNKFGWSDTSYSAYVTTERLEGQEGNRLVVPHEMRSRQYVSEVVDVHVLRHCEDEKYPKLNYQLELNPISVNNSSSNWQDDYTLQAEIMRGRFSVISKGLAKQQATKADGQTTDEQQVVLKFVSTSHAQAAQTKNEYDILRSLQHEKVVQLRAAYRQDDTFVFVMERLSGLDVLTYLSSFAQYNEETVSKIIQQVMDAIEYLHFRGMCLLELQPDNVVMVNGRTTSLKLVDFSSARFVPRTGARVPVNASQNIEYCPPEVIAGHEVSTASDVWCIGVLTYVLLSGFSPFKGDSGEDETRENVRLGRYKYDHIYPNCTPEVTRFLINVFKKHSSKRPTIEQLYENKWLLPNEFMIRKRQHATFRTDKIAAFAEEFHKMKQQQ